MLLTALSPKRATTLAAAAAILAAVGSNLAASPVQAMPATSAVTAPASAAGTEVTMPSKWLPARGLFIPPHVRGDGEFDGHGPEVTVGADLLVDQRTLKVRVSMFAEETR